MKCGKILYSRAGHRLQYGACAVHAGYLRLRATLRIWNTYCFSIVTMVTRMGPSVALYSQFLPCRALFTQKFEIQTVELRQYWSLEHTVLTDIFCVQHSEMFWQHSTIFYHHLPLKIGHNQWSYWHVHWQLPRNRTSISFSYQYCLINYTVALSIPSQLRQLGVRDTAIAVNARYGWRYLIFNKYIYIYIHTYNLLTNNIRKLTIPRINHLLNYSNYARGWTHEGPGFDSRQVILFSPKRPDGLWAYSASDSTGTGSYFPGCVNPF
jgi:hypothetical protein